MKMAPFTTGFIILVSVACLQIYGSSLEGYKVVRTIPVTEEQLQHLRNVWRANVLDFWTEPRGTGYPVDIMVSPHQYRLIVQDFHSNNMNFEVTIPDVQKAADDQVNVSPNPDLQSGEFDYSVYHRYNEIDQWMSDLAQKYPDLVTKFTVGKTYENRDINMIKVSSPTTQPRDDFWIEGGIHAREWISPATVVYMTGQLLEKYSTDASIKKVVDQFTWYILPVFNVDGYEYTWTGGSNRNWRKTRSKHGLCYGVDPNRNWDYHWCEEGASRDPCSDTYCGPSAFSEIEIKTVTDFMLANVTKMKGFIDFHSFSQLWMTPWGYTKELPADYASQKKGAQMAVEALTKVHGTKYEYGSIANIIYVASGSSADWTYGKLNATYSYGVELRDKGQYGFLLPANQIIPSGEETLDGLIALANFVYNN